MLMVDLRDPTVNQFNSNMTQKMSGWDGQLGTSRRPASHIPLAPAEAGPPCPLWLPASLVALCHRARGVSLLPWPWALAFPSLTQLVTGLRPVPPVTGKVHRALAAFLCPDRSWGWMASPGGCGSAVGGLQNKSHIEGPSLQVS